VINEDTNGDAALLRLENRRLRQELALARGLIATGSEGGVEGQAAAAEQLEQQHVQLQQALGLLSELGKRNGDLEDALEYSKRWGCWSNVVTLGQTCSNSDAAAADSRSTSCMQCMTSKACTLEAK
jgi:hypothetical protein